MLHAVRLAHVNVGDARCVRQVPDDVAAGQLLRDVLARAQHEVGLEQAQTGDGRVHGHEVGVQRHGDGQAGAGDSLRIQGQLDGDVVEAHQEGVGGILQPDLQLAVVPQVGGAQYARGLGKAAVLHQAAGADGVGAEGCGGAVSESVPGAQQLLNAIGAAPFRSKLLVVAASMPPPMKVPSVGRLARTLHLALFQLWAVKVLVQSGEDGEPVGWEDESATIENGSARRQRGHPRGRPLCTHPVEHEAGVIGREGLRSADGCIV